MNVPFVDLKRQYKVLKHEINPVIKRVLENTQYILGNEITQFEKEFADFCEVKYCVGVDSGTSALELSLKALGIGKGDEVITTSNTFIATAFAISLTGAKPVFVEVDPQTYNIDPEKIPEKITSRTKAIIPVHLYGQPAEMDEVVRIAKENDLHIVEDACQAHGAEYKGQKAGSFGDAGCFSFYPSKNLGAFGDGGAVVTNNKELADQIKMLRNYGQREKYHHQMLGYNKRLDTLQAAILRVKLKHLEVWNQKRRENAALYTKLLSDTKLVTPYVPDHVKPVYHLYVIRSAQRNKLQNHLKNNNVSTGIHYPVPIHLQEAYSSLGIEQGSFPITEQYANEVLSLPMYPELTEEQINFVVRQVKKFQTG